MSKHTSGPWHVTRGWQGGTVIRSISPDYDDYGKVVVEMESSSTALMGREEAKANSRLICAAPDLLTELSEVVRWYKACLGEDPFFPQEAAVFQRAEDAIAKAGGAK